MAIFLLTPVDRDDADWLASSHCGPVIVRAANVQEARETAARAFDVKTGFRPGEGVRFPPWTRATMVQAQRVDDSRFDADGPAQVLEPAL